MSHGHHNYQQAMMRYWITNRAALLTHFSSGVILITPSGNPTYRHIRETDFAFKSKVVQREHQGRAPLVKYVVEEQWRGHVPSNISSNGHRDMSRMVRQSNLRYGFIEGDESLKRYFGIQKAR